MGTNKEFLDKTGSSYDLIISDIYYGQALMPNMDGITMAQKIKKI